ncbi:tetratricopeptide repeat protein [Ochrobactrum sp. RH2CCR150]|uniref:tetratricopeptide repeat protein n=1 Tax=Ochrobactrum sp. RH2CCR150 TaxID=2587044 RepID=UPI0018260EE3|nr:type III secretion protein Y [Ochrobactrum sp. RH2CCR150]
MLGYVYGCHGQAKRGAAYLLIAAQSSPNDIGVLRTLSHLLTLDGEADKALDTISRLETLDDTRNPALYLLKSRALLAAGRQEEARQAFDRFLKLRAGPDE